MLAIAVARSSTDYSLYVNGQSADGTLDFGSNIALDRAWAFGGFLNGGLFAAGYGAGRGSDEPTRGGGSLSRAPAPSRAMRSPRRLVRPGRSP